MLHKVCAFLGVDLRRRRCSIPTKDRAALGGQFSRRNCAFDARHCTEPVDRWRTTLLPTRRNRLGGVALPSDVMEPLGYEADPHRAARSQGLGLTSVRGETPREYPQSRFYALRGRWKRN